MLFEIDPRPFEAALAQARAQLGEAQAQLGKTERDLARDRPLAEQRAIAQSQLDNDVQANLAAQAAVKSATAAVETAQLNVGFTKVTSLIDGVAAIATAQIGDLVGPTTLLTTVSQIDPIKAYFPLSEQEYLQIAGRINGRGARRRRGQGGAGLTLILADGSVYPRTRHVPRRRSRDRREDRHDPHQRDVSQSGSHAAARAVRPRPRRNAACVTDALLVPQRAVTELQGSFQVRVVGAGQQGRRTRTVKVGDRVGSRWIIEQGLEPGARVVVEGAPTRDGTVVTPKPFTRAGAKDAEPCPDSSSAVRSSPSSSRSSPCSAGLVAMQALPIAQFPDIIPPQIIVIGHLHRRRRADDRAVGRHAARAADERRRQHALHAVDQRATTARCS